MPARIVIIDDDKDVRASILSLLGTYGYAALSFASLEAFLAGHASAPTDLVLLDVNMPGRDGMAALKIIKQKFPQLPVIMVTGYGSVALAVKALKDGAADFIEKPLNDEQLHDAIQHALGSTRPASAADEERSELRRRYEALTARERDVLRMVAEGHTSQSIAANLGIAKKTVDHHRSSIAAKMAATSVSQLIRSYLLLEDRLKPEG
jgi:FixJ family two-component response regulator